MKHKLFSHSLTELAVSVALMCAVTTGQAQDKKPNILILWGDDIGYWNLSAYNQGMMGYQTPNIDRIAKEGERPVWISLVPKEQALERAASVEGHADLPLRGFAGRFK